MSRVKKPDNNWGNPGPALCCNTSIVSGAPVSLIDRPKYLGITEPPPRQLIQFHLNHTRTLGRLCAISHVPMGIATSGRQVLTRPSLPATDS